MEQPVNNLVDMQRISCSRYKDRDMYGEKAGDAFRWVTFGQFGEMVHRMRAALANLGVGPGDKVAIIANNCLDWPVSAYATYGLCAQFVPMYEMQPVEDWNHIVKDSGAKVLLVRTPELAKKVKFFPEDIDTLQALVCLSGVAEDAHSAAELIDKTRHSLVPSLSPAPDEPFGLIYTSGTTGKPKGVILTHRNLITQLESIAELADLSSTDRSLSFLPWGHLMGQIVEVHLLIYKGFSAAIVQDVQQIVKDFALAAPTVFFAVPRLLNRFYEGVQENIRKKGGLAQLLFNRFTAAQRQISAGIRPGLKDRLVLAVADRLVGSKLRNVFGGRLRWMTCGGAAVSPEVIEFFDSLDILVYEGYGLTETTMAVTFNSKDERRVGSVGKPVESARIVLDKSLGRPGTDEGEIVVYGPLVTPGYHNLTEVFAECLTEDGGLRTGDLGRFDEDGFLYVTGRIKELYKLSNGLYIAPAPLEEKLKQSPYVNNAMIYGDNRPYNIIVIVPEMSTLTEFAKKHGLDTSWDGWVNDPRVRELLHREVETFCAGFKAYEKPKKILIVTDDWTPENGLLTPTLKIIRRRAMEKYSTLIEEQYVSETGRQP